MKRLALGLLGLALAPVSPAQVITFDLEGTGGSGLLSTNETGIINGTPGSGGEFGAGIALDQSTNILTINVAWGSTNGFDDLTGTATNAHIHGPGDFNTASGVVFGLTSAYNISARIGVS